MASTWKKEGYFCVWPFCRIVSCLLACVQLPLLKKKTTTTTECLSVWQPFLIRARYAWNCGHLATRRTAGITHCTDEHVSARKSIKPFSLHASLLLLLLSGVQNQVVFYPLAQEHIDLTVHGNQSRENTFNFVYMKEYGSSLKVRIPQTWLCSELAG